MQRAEARSRELLARVRLLDAEQAFVPAKLGTAGGACGLQVSEAVLVHAFILHLSHTIQLQKHRPSCHPSCLPSIIQLSHP